MRRFDRLDQVPTGMRTAVTIGKFDGVHLGHRAVLRRLREAAAERGLDELVLTFDRNPLEVLRPELCPPELTSLQQKAALLAEAGVPNLFVLAFDAEVASEEPEEWLRRTVVEGLGARYLLVGPDFRFGRRGRGDVALLGALAGELGFELEVLTEFTAGELRISSTRIRALLDEGDIAAAAALLGRPPAVTGVVVEGDRRGRALGVPTANLAPEAQGFMPADGVYAGTLSRGAQHWAAAISVGRNPSFEGVAQRRIEAHALEAPADLDLYGAEVTVAFLARLRPMLAFDSIEALMAQMRLDIAETARIVSVHPS